MVRPAPKSNKRGGIPNKPSPVANIAKIGSLNRFKDKEYANSLLHQVAKLVAPIIHENNFKVGTLCEMFPKNANLLGLNVNRGQKILIRLRHHHNDQHFYPLGDIIGTFLHELTHNLYGAHDSKFYAFLDGLKRRFEEIQTGATVDNYYCEEQKLGTGYNASGGFRLIKEKRIEVLSKIKFKSERRKLGTLSAGRVAKPKTPQEMRALALEAAERRLRDAKWCPSDVNVKEVEDEGGEVDLEEVSKEEFNKLSSANKENITKENIPKATESDTTAEKFREYKEVVDLTDDDPSGRIIVIDGCESGDKYNSDSSDSSVSKAAEHHTVVQLLPSFDSKGEDAFKATLVHSEGTDEDPIQYTFSSSPGRTFIYDEDNEKQYPRRKLVADLDFDQIIKKGDLIIIKPNRVAEKKAPTTKTVKKPRKARKAKARVRKTEERFKKEVKDIDFADLFGDLPQN